MHAYLKGYYGYHNLGDEILLIGVIRYLLDHTRYTQLTIEVRDVHWTRERLTRVLPDHMQHVTLTHPPRSIRAQLSHMMRSLVGQFPHLILGGGEVISTTHRFPHNGWNYLLRYPGIWLGTHSYTLLGGITTPTPPPYHVYTLLAGAQEIIVRDQGSYDIARGANDDVTHYHDRAYDALQHSTPTPPTHTGPYLIINIHPHIYRDQPALVQTIDRTLSEHPGLIPYFVPGDNDQDREAYHLLLQTYPHIQRRDRDTHTLSEILGFVQGAQLVIASRLHILLLAKHLGHQPIPLSYHPKIAKVLNL